MTDEKTPPSNKEKIPEAIRKHNVKTSLEMRDPMGNTMRKNDAYKQTAKDKKIAQERAENSVPDKGNEPFTVSAEDMRQEKRGRLSSEFSRNKDGKGRSR